MVFASCARMSVSAARARTSVVPRPASVRPPAATLVASPAPPSAGSKIPPQRAAASSSVDLLDDDIVEVKAAPKPVSAPPSKPVSQIIAKPGVRASVAPPAVKIPPQAAPKITLLKRDALERVKEAVGELAYFATPWQAAGVCAQALEKALGARAVIIHSYDARTTELRVVAAQGPKADVLLGASALVEDDFVGSTVVANRKPMVMAIDGELPRIAPDRLRAMEAAKSLVATPALAKNDVVAMIEVIDATEANAAVADKAIAHVASQLAAFLSAKK
jgi:hypothetical protein